MAKIQNGIYFIHLDTTDWAALRIRNNQIVNFSEKSTIEGDAIAHDRWVNVFPSEFDYELSRKEFAPIMTLFDTYFERKTDLETIVVSRFDQIGPKPQATRAS